MKREYRLLLLVNGLILLYFLIQFSGPLNLFLNENMNHSKILDSELLPVKYFNTSTDINHTKFVSHSSISNTNTISNGDQDTNNNNNSSSNPHDDLVPDRPLLIPKIIHQTYKTKNVPLKWNETFSSVQRLHQDYQFMFWTDESSRQFIAENYPWFLSTYDSYPYNIMRSDTIRYFVLWHYGGVYIDLDCGVDFKIDPLLAFPAWVRQTDPIGVSNDIMGSVPGHPFFFRVIKELKRYNRNYHISYLTIMYSTGPLFLSTVRHAYYKSFGAAAGPRPGGEVRVLVPIDYELNTRYFFFEAPGSSWHQSDANMIQFMGDHIILTILFFTALIILFLYIQVKLYRWAFARGAKGIMWFLVKKLLFPILFIKSLMMACFLNQREKPQLWAQVLCGNNENSKDKSTTTITVFKDNNRSNMTDSDNDFDEKDYLV